MADKKQTRKFTTKKHLAREQREAKQTRIILMITIIIGVIIVGFVLYGLVDQLIVRPRITVAEVGDATIRVDEFETQVKYQRVQALNQTYQYYSYYQQFGEFGESFLQTAQSLASQLAQPVVFGRGVLDGMIDNILIREEAEKRGITVSEEEINEQLQASFNFFPDGTLTPTATATILSTPTYSPTQLALVTLTPTPTETGLPTDTPEVTATISEEENQETQTEEEAIPTEEATKDIPPTLTLVPTITLTPTPYTTQVYGDNLDEFEELYQPYDFSLNELRDLIEVNLLREKLIEDVTKDFVPVEDEVWARHILVETEEEALEVLELLAQGEDFAALAAEYSTDESNSNQGGNLGWFDKDTMVTEFTEVAFNLEVGEISDPVETSFGYHILQVLGQRESQIPPREFAQEKQSAFTDWLSDLRLSREDIVIYDSWEEYVPDTPAVPDQLLAVLFQSQLPSIPTVAP
jgi:parvulin-like peptidyl-prolyl isomerase